MPENRVRAVALMAALVNTPFILKRLPPVFITRLILKLPTVHRPALESPRARDVSPRTSARVV